MRRDWPVYQRPATFTKRMTRTAALCGSRLYGPLWLANTIVVNSQPALEVMGRTIPRLVQKVPGRLQRRFTTTRRTQTGAAQPALPASQRGPTVAPEGSTPRALEAVGRLRSRGYDVRIELAGSVFPGYEWYLEELKDRAAQPDLSGAVSFAGYCSPFGQTSSARIWWSNPSLRESFGNAVIEAQIAFGQ